MRVAALNDIHGNLPALGAVLAEVRDVGVDLVVVGGDVLPGPMPRETLDALLDLEIPTQFIYGNGELAVLAQIDAADPAEANYWGTTSGEPLPEPVRDVVRWTGEQLAPRHIDTLRQWSTTFELDHPVFGRVLFCHGTPRSETEVFTRLTPEGSLAHVFDDGDAELVVCGHTHMQFDRMIGSTRVVNAGSVGMPFGAPGAHWLLLAEAISLMNTSYDLAGAAERVRATSYPQAAEFALSVEVPPSEADMLGAFTHASFG